MTHWVKSFSWQAEQWTIKVIVTPTKSCILQIKQGRLMTMVIPTYRFELFFCCIFLGLPQHVKIFVGFVDDTKNSEHTTWFTFFRLDFELNKFSNWTCWKHQHSHLAGGFIVLSWALHGSPVCQSKVTAANHDGLFILWLHPGATSIFVYVCVRWVVVSI